MPLAAPIAAALTDASAHPYSLLIGGVDYIVGRGGNAPAVPVETVVIDQQGSGGVSSLECVLIDPTGSLSVADGTRVAFWNLSAGDCYFLGVVDTVVVHPYGGPGRSLEIKATGIEAALDWSLIGSLSLGPPGPTLGTAIAYAGDVGNLTAQLVSQFGVLGIWGISTNTISDAPAGNATIPIGTDLVDGSGVGPQLQLPLGSGIPFGGPDYAVTFTNTTLRSAIETLIAAAQTYLPNLFPAGRRFLPVLTTVDTMGRVRMFCDAPGVQPSDYATLVVSDTVGSSLVASGLEHDIEYSDVVHAVYVAGATAASSGYYGDGTGIGGKVGTTSTTGTTLDAGLAAAQAYFTSRPSVVYRGSFALIDIAPPADVWPGSLLTLTDAAAGATGSYRIGSIKRTFNGDRETWAVTYGRLAPSLVQMVRRLTRSVLS